MAWVERQLFILLLWISAAVSLIADSSSGDGNVPLAGALLVGIAAWLHLVCKVHRWTIDKVESRSHLIATAGLVLLFAGLVFTDASYLFMLFGVFGFTFGYSDNPRIAALVSAVITALWIGAWLFHDLPQGAIATPVFVWGIANAINVLSTRISIQNVERGELIERLNATREELATAERERGALEERSRLAREIHDTLAQGFTSVVLLSEAMHGQIDTMPREQVGESLLLLSATARDNLAEARQLIAAEPPAALEKGSLADALRALADDVARRTNAEVNVDAAADLAFGGSEEVVLFRIAQEACNNIIKYAEPTRVEVTLSLDDGTAGIIIADDGVGFDPDAAMAGTSNKTNDLRGGSGLPFMAERVHEFGGQLGIDSILGEGTTVRATIPIGGAR